MSSSHRFASHLNFLDPQFNKDGEPYGPWRYKQIVRECYLITKNMNTSYIDILKISPREREYLLQFLTEEFEKNKEAMEKASKKK